MTAKTFDDFDLRNGKSVQAKLGLVPPDDHLGLLYEAWLVAVERYDPLKSNWLTFFGYTIRSEVQNDRRYNGKLVSVPVKEQSNELYDHRYVPLDHSVDDSPLHDIIPDTRDAEPEAPVLAFLMDELASMYTIAKGNRRKAVKAFQHHLLDDEPLPRKLRTELTWVRQELYERYKRWKEID